MLARYIILAIILILGAFVYYYAEEPVAPPSTGTTEPTDARNVSYEIENTRVTLINGEAVTETSQGSSSQAITRYFGNEARGDFNHDGIEDLALLLTRESGGSGTFFYVAVALKTDSGYKGTNALLLGDRIAPQTTEYRLGKIIVNFAERKPDEPMTAQPSVGVSRYFEVRGDSLYASE